MMPEVSIRVLRTDTSGDLVARFERILADDEKIRAAGFHLDQPRRSFVIARGALRCLLGRRLNVDPVRLTFHYGAGGKPSVASEPAVAFSLSHSGDLAALAFTIGGEIGIDVERIRPVPALGAIAAEFFRPEEAAEIASLTGSAREQAFFRSWTRTEAILKATGHGWARPSLASDRAGWTVHDLDLAPGYAGAVAYRGPQRHLWVAPITEPRDLL